MDIKSQILCKVCDKITVLFPNSNDCTVKVWEWISNFMPNSIMEVITHPCADLVNSCQWKGPSWPATCCGIRGIQPYLVMMSRFRCIVTVFKSNMMGVMCFRGWRSATQTDACWNLRNWLYNSNEWMGKCGRDLSKHQRLHWVVEWISNFIKCFTRNVNTYSCWD